MTLDLPPLGPFAQPLAPDAVLFDLLEELVLDLGDALAHAHGPQNLTAGLHKPPRDTIQGMSSLQAPAGLQPSASYSFTMRIELRQLPGAFAQVAAAIGNEGAILGAIDLVRVDKGGVIRDVTVACVDAAHGERVVNAVRGAGGREGLERLGPHVPDAQGRQDRGHAEDRDQDPRRPLDGLHARRRARLLGDPRGRGSRPGR